MIDWLVVGLGSPGDEYRDTRHNLGHRVVDAFRRAHWGKTGKHSGMVAAQRVLVCTSPRLMNECGDGIAAMAALHALPTSRLVVVHDDICVALGRVRVRKGGETTHRGVRSVAAAMRTPQFWRVRCGIGRPEASAPVATWVLEPFAKHERLSVAAMVAEAVRQIAAIIEEHGSR